jgi:hypothetical protein
MVNDHEVVSALFHEILDWLHNDTILKGEVSEVLGRTDRTCSEAPDIRIELILDPPVVEMGQGDVVVHQDIVYVQWRVESTMVFGRIGQVFYYIGELADPVIVEYIKMFLLVGGGKDPEVTLPPTIRVQVRG